MQDVDLRVVSYVPPTRVLFFDKLIGSSLSRPTDEVKALRSSVALGRLRLATQRILRRDRTLRLQSRDLVVEARDVRIPFLGQLEGRNRAAGLAHVGADHAEAGIGAEMARLALDGFADILDRGREVAEQPVDGGALVPAF